MTNRRGNEGGCGNRRKGGGANRGPGGGRMRQSARMGRRGRSGMAINQGIGASSAPPSFPEQRGIRPNAHRFEPDNETLIQKLRFIKKQLLEMEHADAASSASRGMPGKLPGDEKGTPGIAAVVDKKKCICCEACAEVCPENAISINGEAMIDPGKCNACGTCISVCPNEAISLSELRKAANS